MSLTISNFEDTESIESCKIVKKAFQHSVCVFTARIGKNETDKFYEKIDRQIAVVEKEAGNQYPLFRGYVNKIDAIESKGSSLIKVTAVSGSAKTDIKRFNRVFQDTEKKFTDIISQTAGDSQGNYRFTADTGNVKDDIKFEQPVVQYEETDFEFLRRLCYTAKCAIFPKDSDETVLTVGTKMESGSDKLDKIEESAVSRVHKLWKYDKSREENIQILRITSASFFNFGHEVQYDGINYIIFSWKYDLKNKADKFTYEMCQEGKIPCNPVVPPAQRVYIEAKVTNISDSENLGRIEVEFTDKDFKELGKGKKFQIPFRSPYTASDNGIVFLPEKDDIVEVIYTRGTFFSGSVLRKKALNSEVSTVEDKKHIMVYDNRITFNKDCLEILRQNGGKYNTIKVSDDSILLQIGDSTIEMKSDSITVSVKKSTLTITSDKIDISGAKKMNVSCSESTSVSSSKIILKK
ncbi:MAG: hypothetical protein HDT23_00060 [Ruminococcus sp.]|nr:hypothetical protein [Ruminococcus sp.]